MLDCLRWRSFWRRPDLSALPAWAAGRWASAPWRRWAAPPSPTVWLPHRWRKRIATPGKNTAILIVVSDVKWRDNTPCSVICWLIVYCFVPFKNISHIQGRQIACEGLQNLDTALPAFKEMYNIFIVSHLLWQKTSVYTASPAGPPCFIVFYDKQEKQQKINLICSIYFLFV